MHAPDPITVALALDNTVVEYLEDDRTSFTYSEAVTLAHELGFSTAVEVIAGLKERGLTMDTREPEKTIRGFRSNPHNRYSDPANRTHGGSGWSNITGFAGQAG